MLVFSRETAVFSAIPILISLTFVPIHPSAISHARALQPTQANDNAPAGYGMERDGSAKPLTIDP
jgi:hypothetical protein